MNGDPNDSTDKVYPDGVYDEDPPLLTWETFDQNEGWFIFQSPNGNVEHPGEKMKMENYYKEAICDYWDTEDAYLNI